MPDRRLTASVLVTLTALLGALTAAPGVQAAGPEPQARHPIRFAAPALGVATPASLVPQGYIPCDVWGAYGMGSPDATAGSGQTIAVIDPFDYPSVATDLAAFSTAFGLPAATFSTAVVSTGNSSTTSWIPEVALDVQWVHAIAPGASIVWVEAHSSGSSDMLAAIDYAINTVHADVVSMSWTFPESVFPSAAAMASFDAHLSPTNSLGRNVVYVASAGDDGHQVNWPAESPRVIGVGGTSVAPAGYGYASTPASHTDCTHRASAPGVTPSNETVWGTAAGGNGTGGGVATLETLPTYQSTAGIGAAGRAVPDVAVVGDPSTGVATYINGEWSNTLTGGTSLGAPIWAAVVARLNAAAPPNQSGVAWLYSLPQSSFNDITAGVAPPVGGTACILSTTDSCAAKVGFDYVTGRGSPLYASLAGRPPSAPGSPSAVAGDRAATVSWTAAAANGSPITSYTVTTVPGGAQVTVPGSATSVTVTGLTNGSSYSFTIGARNAAGAGPTASTGSVTPQARTAAVAGPTAPPVARSAPGPGPTASPPPRAAPAGTAALSGAPSAAASGTAAQPAAAAATPLSVPSTAAVVQPAGADSSRLPGQVGEFRLNLGGPAVGPVP